MTQRTDRIDELLRQEIGELIAREIGDPRVGFVTVTDVETAPDLRHAKVWVSVIGTPEERDAAVGALGRAMPFIRHELGARLRIKRIPELHVRLDDTLERGTRVLRLLTELESGVDPAELAVPPAHLPTPVARLPHEGDAPEPEPDPATPVDSGRTGAPRPARAKGGASKRGFRRPAAGRGGGRETRDGSERRGSRGDRR
ncbi:MAG TPA: 30S ribosome-binding factor RbfA [Candidatus Sulfomarinibacteraceae bacterium]|nr:30S ribosome-binding factor RbfA [Candidatus Sulfomarinibacteraceae bacterium]